jgi:hypothetical protein
MKYMKSLIFVISLFLSSYCAASDEEYIWVAIADSVAEYQTPITITLFNKLLDGKYKKEYLHIKNVYWLNEENNIIQRQVVAGVSFGYTNDTYIRTKEIIRITPLSKTHIKSNALTYK